MLSFHRVREAIAARILGFFCLSGCDNPADILSKQWEYTKVRETLKFLLFWRGYNANMIDE
jgi:hypothetical protein